MCVCVVVGENLNWSCCKPLSHFHTVNLRYTKEDLSDRLSCTASRSLPPSSTSTSSGSRIVAVGVGLVARQGHEIQQLQSFLRLSSQIKLFLHARVMQAPQGHWDPTSTKHRDFLLDCNRCLSYDIHPTTFQAGHLPSRLSCTRAQCSCEAHHVRGWRVCGRGRESHKGA